MKRSIILSAFPGTGKSHLSLNYNGVVDADSYYFDNSGFPMNYVSYVKENANKYKIICLSTGKDGFSARETLNSLVDNGVDFYLFYPDISLKEEYIERYKQRNDRKEFIDMMSENWESWISELQQQKGCQHIVLKSGEYLSDYFG